jgi:hypothetical protein
MSLRCDEKIFVAQIQLLAGVRIPDRLKLARSLQSSRHVSEID